MRGKEALLKLLKTDDRITPAYAGKRRAFCAREHLSKDHPRVCGEKSLLKNRPQVTHGSPPLMRGKAAKSGAKEGRNRITPAYAGKRYRSKKSEAAL